MGRVKLQMRKLEDRQQRNIAFSKRKSGLLKKAYELYTLCDVQIALMLFSPAGKLFLFEPKARIEETIQKYLNLPSNKRGCLQEESSIKKWVEAMRLETMDIQLSLSGSFDDGVVYESGFKTIEDEIDECNVMLANVNKQLGYFVNDTHNPKSKDEINFQEKLLQVTLDQVRARRQNLEAESIFTYVPNSYFETNLEISTVE